MRGNTPPTTRSPPHQSRLTGNPRNLQPVTVSEEERGWRDPTSRRTLMRAAPDCRPPPTAWHASQPRSSSTSHPPQQQDAVLQAEANCFSLAFTGVKQYPKHKVRTCKTLEAEVKELRGEPQASTSGLKEVQCGRGEGCNAMSQQNLEEEAGCGQTDCRKMKKQAMAKRTADKEAGNGQATGLQKTPRDLL